MNDDIRHFRSKILSIIQPLSRGTFSTIDKISATITGLIPFGTGDRFQHALPFGISSNPIPGILAYFFNLHGNAQAPVILSHLDINRPFPTDVGGFMFYCTTADGASNPVTIELSPLGKLIVTSSVDVEINSPTIKLGSGAQDPVPLGTELQALLSNILDKLSSLSNTLATHTHVGNLGYPTAPPDQAAAFTTLKTNFDNYNASPVQDGTLLSEVAFTKRD
jgi:hypothetical protein